MFRRIRNDLRRISYYSRARPRTAWTRAVERALPLSLALAVPATLLSEHLWLRAVPLVEIKGRLVRAPEGGLGAAVIAEPGQAPWTEGAPWGEWVLRRHRTLGGWPFPSVSRPQAVELDLHRFDETATRIGLVLPEQAPERRAITQALLTAGREDLLEAWRDGTPRPPARAWAAAAADVMAWWVLLAALSVAGIRAAALAAHLARTRRTSTGAARAARGRCPVCDYDLRGLEYSPRCPECGSLLRR